MKVKIPDDAKNWMTLAELAAAREIIKQMKEDDSSAADYIAAAASCWLCYSGKNDYRSAVLGASAEIARYARVWNRYGEESGNLDVWLSGIVQTIDGFLKISCCLSDVWEIGPEDFNRSFPSLCYARYYTEEK